MKVVLTVLVWMLGLLMLGLGFLFLYRGMNPLMAVFAIAASFLWMWNGMLWIKDTPGKSEP